MLKQTLELLTLSALALSLVACGQQAETPRSAQTAQTATSTQRTESAASTQPVAGSEDDDLDLSQVSASSVLVQGVAFLIPEEWVKETPSSDMRLAQYRIDGDAGPAQVVFSSFGGGAQMNVQRWIGQFENPTGPGGTGAPIIANEKVDGLEVTLVRVEGIYSPGAMGPMMPAPDPEPDHALHGVIVTGGPQGTIFIKTTGPAATVNANQAGLDAMARSATSH